MSESVRVRFAPSPTGYLHLGGIRSALFNYLFAKGHDGTFVLRLEDTDRERFVPGSVVAISDSLDWLGIAPDEGPANPSAGFGPYIQSERLNLYQQYAEELLGQGKLYRDYTTPDQLDALRRNAQAEKRAFTFSRAFSHDTPQFEDQQPVLRFAIPEGPDVVWDDAVRGEQRWQRATLDDFVAIKSDGYPTYHFANVVDDRLMEISHVIRAAEWIPSTAKHILLYEAFGWPVPTFAHLPQVLGPDKAKLSKRHGAQSVLEYRDQGYLPEAVLNYLAALGFNDGTTQEIYTREELIKIFSFDRVQSSPAVFDATRLAWINGLYIRQLEVDDLYERVAGFWPSEASSFDDSYRSRVLQLVQERLKYFAELPDLTRFFFEDPSPTEAVIPKQLDAEQTRNLLGEIVATLSDSDFSESNLEVRLRELVSKKAMKVGVVFGVIRVAITGSTAAPGLFETLHTLGKATSLRRLQNAANSL